jgi:cellobiose dehydrogenase (acceptor)
MARSLIFSTVLFALQVVAQSATPYTDANTGITFNGYQDATGYTFGIALPENPTTDFIAQVQAPTAAGWAGFSMGQSMVGNLLAIAWPSDGKIVSSFRLAT